MVSSPVRAGSKAHTTPGRSSSEQEENSRGIEDNRFAIASCKLSLGTNWLRDANSYWSESLIEKRGQAPVQFGVIGFQSRCVIGAVPGTSDARGLRLDGSRAIRLRRLNQPIGGQSDRSPNHWAALVLNNLSIRSEDQESCDSQRFRIRPSVDPDPTKCV